MCKITKLKVLFKGIFFVKFNNLYWLYVDGLLIQTFHLFQRLRMEMEDITNQQYQHERTLKVNIIFTITVESSMFLAIMSKVFKSLENKF